MLTPALFCLVLMAAPAPAAPAATDQWLQIDPFRSDTTVTTKVALLTGSFDHPDQVLRRSADEYVRLDLRVPKGSDVILDNVLQTGPLLFSLDMVRLGLGADSYLLALDTAPATSELDGAAFTTWLHREGLQDILAQRAKQGHQTSPGELRNSHHLKSIFQRGPAPEDFVTMAVAQDLEIVPLQNPYKLAPGSTLPLVVTFHGQPLAGRQVTAISRKAGKDSIRTARTDARGRVSFAVEPGDWLIKLVALEPSKEPDADWRAYWSSLTFSIGP